MQGLNRVGAKNIGPDSKVGANVSPARHRPGGQTLGERTWCA